MKFINKLLLLALIVGFAACDANLDLQDNPNAVTPENASVNDLYNNIQLTFAGAFLSMEYTGGQLSRMYQMGTYVYENHTNANTSNGMWFNAYSELFPDIDALLALTEERGLDVHSGSVKIMKAYVLMGLVDNLGSAVLSEAGQGTDVISPKRDDGAAVYAAAVVLLDDAITQLSSTAAAGPTNDLYYNGSAASWATLAKTLKLRAAVTTRLTDGTAAATINALVSAGDIIDETTEDFQAQLGNQRLNPNSRHWMYNNHYEIGDGDYLSNYYMWLLRIDKVNADGNTVIDPRIRYYFYRQVEDADGQDPTTYGCHFSELPGDRNDKVAHFDNVDPRLPYCIVVSGDGYSGRDHGNGEGTPPDGPVRSHYGLYPGGGQFDDDSFTDTRQAGTSGGKGEGIYPIMLASYVDFMRAEAALTIGTNDDARVLLESGIRKSIAKVQSFSSLDPGTFGRLVPSRTGPDVPVSELFVPTAEDIDTYVDLVLANYDAASDKLDVVMKEYYIALWGNGLEAYNMYRRTGKPANMQPTLEPAGGTFINSLFLPAVHVNRNSVATQKELTDRVFWDDGSATTY